MQTTDATRAQSQQNLAVTELFRRYHIPLRRNVRAAVKTSDENVEDACMFAWTQLLSHELEHPEAAYGWLITVAIREALKLDRRTRRTLPLVAEHGEVLAVVDPNDHLQRTQLLLEAADIIQTAGVTRRQARILGLQALGLSYEEIHAQTGDSRRTIERQIRSARQKLGRALSEFGG